MARNEMLIDNIQDDLTDFHRRRMAQRAGEQAHLLREERGQPRPNQMRIETIRAAMAETKRNSFNTDLTIEEVIEPLRHGVSIGAISFADKLMADPQAWRQQPQVTASAPQKKTARRLAAG
ncbi:hypothetical protein [Xanthomonas euvesicatoria]|uniref:hypothetical protein n=1 Tax=Xanthomonas euvesicatoria TaxID=456327 RepID=UPI001C496956|nr:hypothetical protein [Xanthomonas euvesicatoria]MBV6867888.1 hypothetical protein [Xanthomonas campestris pv. coriandri]MCE4330808.1 hypothetical protein [Xanthomonas campestris pv. coriandri]